MIPVVSLFMPGAVEEAPEQHGRRKHRRDGGFGYTRDGRFFHCLPHDVFIYRPSVARMFGGAQASSGAGLIPLRRLRYLLRFLPVPV